jgi:plastocyanin
MRTLVLTLAAAFALGGAATAQTYGPNPDPSPAATAGPSSAPAPASSAAPSTTAVRPVVHIKDFAFVPATITVKAGQSVLFVQDDQTPHTVTASDKSYDSGNLDQRATWAHAFTAPGTYTYVCAYHPNMKGTVVVK